jgi:hypothetical protein
MSGISMGFFMVLASLMGLGGLTLAARSGDLALVFGGLVAFVLAVLFCFFLIKKWFDAAEDRAV